MIRKPFRQFTVEVTIVSIHRTQQLLYCTVLMLCYTDAVSYCCCIILMLYYVVAVLHCHRSYRKTSLIVLYFLLPNENIFSDRWSGKNPFLATRRRIHKHQLRENLSIRKCADIHPTFLSYLQTLVCKFHVSIKYPPPPPPQPPPPPLRKRVVPM